MNHKRILALAGAALLASGLFARADNVITNYFPGYVSITNGWATVEDTGLTPGTAYVAIPLTALPQATAAAVEADGETSDVRVLLYAVNEQAATVYLSTVASNRPAYTVISKSASMSGVNDYNVTHQVQTKWTLSATLTPK